VDGVASYPYGQLGGSTLGASLPARMPESNGRHTLIVSPDGSGTSCSVASPCSIRRAFGRAVSGDLIYARGNAGDYTGYLRIKNRDYSSSDPVTLETFPADFAAGRAATFTGCSSPLPNNSLTFEGDAGIRLRKLRFAARQNIELAVHETQHFEVTQSVFRDAGRSCKDDFPSCSGMGLLAGGGDTGYTPSYDDDIQVWNSVFTNDGGPGTAGVTNHDHAIYLCGGSGQTTGLEDGCRSFVIANNLLFDSPDGYPIQLGQSARNGFIVNNTIDNSTAGSPPACAIVIWGTGTWADSNDLIANNIITNVTGSGSNAVCASLGKNLTGNVVRNNLAYGVSGTPYDPTYGSYTGFTVGPNPPSTDPLYVNTTGTYGSESKDFHLQPGSPARGKADPTYTPPVDRDGNFRPISASLGAYG
jgi:hypothetical protein